MKTYLSKLRRESPKIVVIGVTIVKISRNRLKKGQKPG